MTPPFIPTSIAISFIKFRWRASPHPSVPWSRWPPLASPPTPTASFTASATTPRTLLHRRPAHHRPAEQSLLQPASFQLRPVARGYYRARRPPNTAAKPASSSRSPPVPARVSPSPPAVSHPPTAPSAPRPAVFDLSLRQQELGQLPRSRRPQHRPLPRSTRVRRLPRQRQRV